jgi:hypothetical protein
MLFDFLINLQSISLNEFNFKLGDDYYDFNALHPKTLDYDNHVIIFDLHKSCRSNSAKEFKDFMLFEYKDNLCYSLVFEINKKFYDVTDLVSITTYPKCFHFNLKEHAPETVDCATLNMLYERSSRYHGCDFNNAKIVTQGNGVEVELKPEHIHFTIGVNENGEDDYRIVLDI